ncbi:MAG: ABC transporter substrate-binding protein [Methanomicrobiaceae archaeon]|nr:ABC transporter substrate-binding protein [Methanomicrobiaceae archaeon]
MMKKKCLAAIIVLISVFTLLTPVCALPDGFVPQNSDEIHEYADQVLKEEILDYISATRLNEETKCLTADELSTAINNYPEYPRRITDTVGAEIVLVEPLNRIVAYNFHAMGALEAEDLVVGVANSAFEDACVVPEINDKENVGGGGPYEPDFEKILALEPDALLTYTELGPGADFFENRMPEGVPVIRLDFIRPWYLVEEMEKLGYLTDRTEQSTEYVEWHDGIMNEIDNRLSQIPEDEKLRVFVDVWSTTYQQGDGNERRTVSDADQYSYYCNNAGGVNVAGDLNIPQGTIDIEWIAMQNPDVILGVAYDGSYNSDDISELKVQYDEIVNHPALQDISAVRNNRVYILSYRHVNGLAYPAARAQVVKWFYPELFSDMAPEGIHQELVTDILGSSFDVSEHGVFNYPQ